MSDCKPRARAGGSGPAWRTASWRTALLGLAVAALAAGVPAATEAHYENAHQYLEVTMDVLDYEVREYDEFNLVRVELQIDNQGEFDVWDARFYLGGTSDADDPFSTGSEFNSTSGAAIRDTHDIDASDSDCAESLPNLVAGTSGRISACYVVGKTFEPDGLRLFQHNTHPDSPSHTPPYDPYHDGGYVSLLDPSHCVHIDHSHPCSGHTRVIPFHSDSSYCALYGSYCDADNVQDVGAIPEPESPAPAALLYALYNNNTGTLTLVFDRLVVAQNPDRIGLIHDIEAYIDKGMASDLGDAELSTVDNKRQSQILAFALDEDLRLEVAESLRMHGDLALVVQSGAVYSAEGFADITGHADAGAILVGDLTVIR